MQPKLPQRENIDFESRTGLWSAFYTTTCLNSNKIFLDIGDASGPPIYRRIFVDFLKKPIDECASFFNTDHLTIIKNFFINANWYEVLDLIEFAIRDLSLHEELAAKEVFLNLCNRTLERENSTYRILENGIVTEITSKQDIETIETALQISYAPAREHIAKALTLLSDRESPDYENSIKESISAVESIAKEITGKEKSLNALTQELKLHSNFTKGLDELYNWSSKEFRHGTSGKPIKIDPDTARFMLVICSAFMSYIISKNPKK